FVVPVHAGFRAQLTDVLDEVISEGIVVVDHQDHERNVGEREDSRSGMESLVLALEIVPVNVGIELCGRKISVSQHFLNRPQVGTTLQQVGGKGVPQGGRRPPFLNSGAPGALSDNAPGAHTRERSAPGIEKEAAVGVAAIQPWPEIATVNRCRADRPPAYGY